MLRPVRMEQLNLAVFDTDIDAVTEEIIRLGIMHLVDITEMPPWTGKLDGVSVDEAKKLYAEILRRTKAVLRKLDFEKEAAEMPKKIKAVTIDEMEKALDDIELKINPVIMERDIKKEELAVQQKIYNQIKLFRPLNLKIPSGGRYSFLETAAGRLKEENVAVMKQELGPIPNVVMPFKTDGSGVIVFVIVLKRDKVVLEKAMKESSFQKLELPEEMVEMREHAADRVEEKIKNLHSALMDIELKIQDERKKYLPFLPNFLRVIESMQISIKAKMHFKKTERIYLISGWVPKDKRGLLIKGIKNAAKGRYYIEELEPKMVTAVREGRVKVPVQFSNPKFLRPFEFLISTFGIPEYNVIDPTVFLAVTFLIMFGAMFGDVGHGLVLAGLGLFFIKYKKTLIKIGTIILYSGVSSIIFGILYGSYFGVETFFPALWIRPIHNILHLCMLAVGWGIGVISIGIIINLVNAAANKNFKEFFFDKAGLIGGLIYWGMIGLAVKAFFYKGVPINPGLAVSVIGIPLALLIFRAPIIRLFKMEKELFPQGIASYIIDTIVEIEEIFMGYLTNTVSFIRVAAFALAHAGLFIAIFSLANIVKGARGGIIYSAVILILGNILIIALEGLVVTIQTLRLEYYEFFSKFFTGEGREYKPIKGHI